MALHRGTATPLTHRIKNLRQAGAELGQAQPKLELELCYTSSVLIKLEIAELS